MTMTQNPKHIITIIGNIGAGKTTTLPFVAKALDADLIEADDIFQTINPFRDRFLADIKRWGFTNELWMAHKRVNLIKTAVEQSEKENIVIDSGLIMSWVYTKSHFITGKMDKDEWAFFNELFTQWSKFSFKTTLLYLTAPVDVLLKRIETRGRDYELEMYKKEYLEQIELGLKDLIANFAGVFDDTVTIDYTEIGKLTEESAQKEFMELVRKKFSYTTSAMEDQNPLLTSES